MLDLGLDPDVWPWIWLVAAVVFALVELIFVGGSFIILPWAVSAFVAAILAFYDVPIEVQWSVFVFGGGILFAILYRWAQGFMRGVAMRKAGWLELFTDENEGRAYRYFKERRRSARRAANSPLKVELQSIASCAICRASRSISTSYFATKRFPAIRLLRQSGGLLKKGRRRFVSECPPRWFAGGRVPHSSPTWRSPFYV